MTTKPLKEVIERLQQWPKERQAAAAKMLLEMEAQDASGHRLTDEQAAEVERRLADPGPKFLTLAEVRARLAPPHEGDR
jgi:hypothetical protein